MKEARKWLRSFRYAYEGLQYALTTQKHMKFHFFASFSVLFLALIFKLSKLEILFILLAIVLILVTELINTAIEKTVDLIVQDTHPLAKIAKDVAAAAVLVTSVFAASVGMIVFYNPLNDLLYQVREKVNPMSVGIIWIIIALILLAVIVVQARYSTNHKVTRPSIITALAFSMSTLMTLYITETPVILLSYSLSGLIMIILYEKTDRSFPSLILGGFFGSFITYISYQLIYYF